MKKHGNPPIHRFLHLFFGGLLYVSHPGDACEDPAWAMQQEPIHWRYRPLIKGLFFSKFQGISLENICPKLYGTSINNPLVIHQCVTRGVHRYFSMAKLR